MLGGGPHKASSTYGYLKDCDRRGGGCTCICSYLFQDVLYCFLTCHTLGKPGLEGSFKHPETCSVGQMEFIVNKVRERKGERERGGGGKKEGEGRGRRREGGRKEVHIYSCVHKPYTRMRK